MSNKELLVIIIIIFDDAGLSLYPYSSVLSATPILTQLHTARHPFVANVPQKTGIRPKSHSNVADLLDLYRDLPHASLHHLPALLG